MINSRLTLYKSVINALNKLRYQAKDDKVGFKALLSGILVFDLLEWASNEPQYIQEHLFKLGSKLLRCNPIFSVEYADDSQAYVNVNTPQTIHTWKQVWDSPDVQTLLGQQWKDGEPIRRYTQVQKIIINNNIIADL